jgi:uncharacterized protein YdbL (DUF1318 family)
MIANIVKWSVAALCGLLAACAVITVNVYFPEKDVKQAYKSLDDMLLKQGGDANKPAEGQPPGGQPPATQPAGEQPPGTEENKPPEEVKPQSSLNRTWFNFSLVSVASAAETTADDLAVEMSSMPEVLKAYDEIRVSIPKLNALRDSGAVGESKQGIIAIRDKTKLGDNEAFVKAVNESRKVVITGMARAILKVNKQPETKEAMNQVLGKAAAMFADVRQEKAKPGWWIELPNGRWVQK